MLEFVWKFLCHLSPPLGVGDCDAIHSSLDLSDIVLRTWGISMEKRRFVRMHMFWVFKMPHVSLEINCAPNFTKAQKSAKLLARSSNQCFFFCLFFYCGRRKKVATLWDIGTVWSKINCTLGDSTISSPKAIIFCGRFIEPQLATETQNLFLDLFPWKCCFFVQRFSAIWHKNLQGKRGPAVPAWRHVYLLSSHHYRLN